MRLIRFAPAVLLAASVFAVGGASVAEAGQVPLAFAAHNGDGHGDHGDDDDGDDAKKAQSELDVLAKDCSKSKLPPHDGFQKAPACSSAVFGEISDAAKNPSLLFVDFPDKVKEGEGFTLKISSRNLVRDRFLGAAAGGYYLETSLLNDDGLQRGHFHVSCRVLGSDDEAPVPDLVPQFFKAVEDGKGGAKPDTVKIEVPGKNADGKDLFKKKDLVQCAAWAGDGSHRIPMMERASQNPAFDAVRFKVN